MTNSVHTNTGAAIALQNLNSTTSRLDLTQNRVSTGLKVQGAKDNAAVWAIAQNQRADFSALDSVKNSMNRATSIADVSLAAGAQISDILVEIREKAVAAADPGASQASRDAYNDEFQSLLTSLQSFADNAIFDGENILNGASATALTFIASADASETITLNRQDLSRTGLALPNTLDLTSTANAGTALTAVKAALDTANSRLATLGAEAKQIERHNVYVSKLMDSVEAGIGNLVDADLAKESARLQALQVQQQLGVQALSIANQSPQVILSLFRN
ncbi:flagellin [Brevundimonas sp. NPDC092305]|uniref:flagellin n=1 Tax=Brevundimonas sp. NPDC092305 TaxID=3363957 RepID=UPI0038046D99